MSPELQITLTGGPEKPQKPEKAGPAEEPAAAPVEK